MYAQQDAGLLGSLRIGKLSTKFVLAFVCCFRVRPPVVRGLAPNHYKLRLEPVRSRNDRGCLRRDSGPPYNPPAGPSRPVEMEPRTDGYSYNGKKEDPPIMAAASLAPADVGAPGNPLPGTEQGLASMAEPSALNGSASDTHGGEDALSEEPLRKRRRSSNDSANGTLTPTGKGRSSRGDKVRAPDGDSACPRKRGGNSSSDTESGPSEHELDCDANTQDSYGNGHSPKVPPLKIVLPSSGSGSVEGAEPAGGANCKERKVSSSKPALPYVVNAAESLGEGSPGEQAGEEKERRREEERCQRVTRSSHRAALTHEDDLDDAPEVHPRKRKLRAREEPQPQPQQLQQQQGLVPPQQHQQPQPQGLAAAAQQGQPLPPQGQQSLGPSLGPPTLMEEMIQPITNGFQLYLDIRRQVEKRRRGMLVVHPKPPQGFKDYLLNRGSYVLEGNPSSRLSVPMIPLPQSLSGSPMRDLFLEQERERYKLRLQHLIEREKLVLSAEQEILRVHGRAARAIQNQSVPLSACSILRDEEIYNVLKPEQEKMLLRQHNEAESLHAVQKLDWEWKLKELGLCEVKATPVIDDICVPSVHVSDEFDVLPA
ncbi:hypothetical protein HPB48_003621 [Haemaphysalis longicornis]|uniref:Uncharacterized protein n=1 Tax=Haemaphysalis longicornis TaxID=44386 RepID=A0A9J6FFW0_HAELO|nr:hypothetical protein HPB48_003621 [Haemaphysalis longicornis]